MILFKDKLSNFDSDNALIRSALNVGLNDSVKNGSIQ